MSTPKDPLSSNETPEIPALPGLQPGETIPFEGPTPEQISRMHAASSSFLQAAMDAPAGARTVAGRTVFHGPAKLDPSGGVALGVNPGLPEIPNPFSDQRPKKAVGVSETVNPDGSVTHVMHGRVFTVTKEEQEKRDKAEAAFIHFRDHWEEDYRKAHPDEKKIETGWDAPPPTREQIAHLTELESPHHKCATCRHSVSFVMAESNNSGYGSHPFSKKFCSLLRDDSGGNLEFSDSPVFFCSHYERRWSLWASAQVSRLESRLGGKDSRLARVLRVLREPSNGVSK